MNLNRFISYVKRNPGILFIVSFQVSLVTAAILLSLHNATEAQVSATYGFYFLVTGLLIQLGVFFWEAKKRAKFNAKPPQSST